MTRRPLAAVALLISALPVLSQPQSGPPQATSFLRRKLVALPDDGSIQKAQSALAADAHNPKLALALSKAQAARRQYREAIATCTAALKTSGRDADLYLERGHRELGLREFAGARTDLQHAVQLNPHLLDAHYHLGTANYFLRDFPAAAQSFNAALELAQSSDSIIDCSAWLYVSRRRAGQTNAAAAVLRRITPDMKNTEPHLYFYLRLLRFYQGVLPEDQLLPKPPTGPDDIEGELSFNTINYAVGNWHLYNDKDPARARQFFTRVVKGNAWNSWGFIGSELELAGK